MVTSHASCQINELVDAVCSRGLRAAKEGKWMCGPMTVGSSMEHVKQMVMEELDRQEVEVLGELSRTVKGSVSGSIVSELGWDRVKHKRLLGAIAAEEERPAGLQTLANQVINATRFKKIGEWGLDVRTCEACGEADGWEHMLECYGLGPSGELRSVEGMFGFLRGVRNVERPWENPRLWETDASVPEEASMRE